MQEKVYLCSVKRKERLIWLLKWLLLLAAYAYLAYRLATYRDYPALWLQLRATDVWGWGCLAGCLLLMPLNLLLEALKWRTLLAGICPLSVAEAQRQVYYGFVGAFVTPYRLGDYPARATRLPDPNRWKEAVAMGMYGSIVLTMTIVLTGWIPAFCFFAGEASGNLHLMSVIVLAGGLPICLLPLLKRWFPALGTFFKANLWLVFLQSLARYGVFCLQLYLVLRVFGVIIPLEEVWMAIPVYYLLVTLTPNMPAADAGIRGSWALLVFGRYTDCAPCIVFAVFALWIINTVIPLIVGTTQRG